MNPLTILDIKRLHPEALLPVRATPGSAGLDLAAFLISESGHHVNALLSPRTSKIFRTGLIVLPPPGHVILVCSRSSLAAQNPPIFVANAPGVVDPDYTGELKVVLYNGGFDSAYFKHGDRIAQILVTPYLVPTVHEYDGELPQTERGAKGFGEASKEGITK